MSNELINVDLSAVWRYWVRRLWIAILLTLMAAGGTWLYLKARPVFQARAILMVQAGEPSQPGGTIDPSDLLELAVSAQVVEKTSGEFSKTAGKPAPPLQAQLTLQKRLLLAAKSTDPAAAKTILELWIRELRREYETTFRLNLEQQRIRQENILARLQEMVQKFSSVANRDQQAEIKKSMNQASSKILQFNMLAAAVPDVIKIVVSPSEPVTPYYDPVKSAVIVGILTFGFFAIVILLAGAAKNAK